MLADTKGLSKREYSKDDPIDENDTLQEKDCVKEKTS